MDYTELGIEGVRLYQAPVYDDARGWLCVGWEADDGTPAGFYPAIVFTSWTRRTGVVRGLHKQTGQAKLVTCLIGEIFDVLVDARTNSDTYGKVVTVSLTRGLRLYVPHGVLHGFQSIKPPALVQYVCDVPYKPDEITVVDALDSALGIDWPIKVYKGMRSPQDEHGILFGKQGG